jgi:hypothetical protein
VHPTAIVHDGAQVGAGTVVGPFVVIGPGVVVGRDCRIGASAIIEGCTTIGDHTEVFPLYSGEASKGFEAAGSGKTLISAAELTPNWFWTTIDSVIVVFASAMGMLTATALKAIIRIIAIVIIALILRFIFNFSKSQ